MTASESSGPPRAPHPQQKLLLLVAGGLLAVALVLVLVVALGGSDGPAAGSPEALTDQFAAALSAHDPARVAALTCRSARSQVATTLRGVGAINSAKRIGAASELTDVALVPMQVVGSGGTAGTATISFRHVRGAWCVAGFAVSRTRR